MDRADHDGRRDVPEPMHAAGKPVDASAVDDAGLTDDIGAVDDIDELSGMFAAAFSPLKAPDDVKERALAAMRAAAAGAGEGAASGVPDVAGRDVPAIVDAGSAEDAAPSTPASVADAAPSTPASVADAARSAGTGKTRLRRMARRRIMAIAVAACLIIGMLGGGIAYATPTAYISIEGVPAVTLSVNCFGTTIDAQADNEAGRQVLDEVDVRHRSDDEAIRLVVDKACELGLIQTGDEVLVTVSSDDRTKADEIAGIVSGILTEKGCIPDCASADMDRHEQARDAGMTDGRYRVYRELEEQGSAVDTAQIGDSSIERLMQMRDDAGQGGQAAGGAVQGQNQDQDVDAYQGGGAEGGQSPDGDAAGTGGGGSSSYDAGSSNDDGQTSSSGTGGSTGTGTESGSGVSGASGASETPTAPGPSDGMGSSSSTVAAPGSSDGTGSSSSTVAAPNPPDSASPSSSDGAASDAPAPTTPDNASLGGTGVGAEADTAAAPQQGAFPDRPLR